MGSDALVHTRTSQEVTHPSTTLAKARLTAECISAGMIALVMFCVLKTYMLSIAR